MKRPVLKIVPLVMLVLFLGTVISKDLYHIFLPHPVISHSLDNCSAGHGSQLSGDVGSSDCFICKFEFSNCTETGIHKLPGQIVSYSEYSPSHIGVVHISSILLHFSLRAPPASA